MPSVASRLFHQPGSWAGTAWFLKVGEKQSNLARLGYLLVNFVPQRKNIWRGREGVKIIHMEIPKAKVLRLPFSREHFSFCEGFGRFSNFYYFYSLAPGEKTEQIIIAGIFLCLVSFVKVPIHGTCGIYNPTACV